MKGFSHNTQFERVESTKRPSIIHITRDEKKIVNERETERERGGGG